VNTSDPRRAAVATLLAGLEAGGEADDFEGAVLDCKEDSRSRPQPSRGSAPRDPNDHVARMVADAVACFANANGGVVVLGIQDHLAGLSAINGTPIDEWWLVNRIRQLIGHAVQIEALETHGHRILTIYTDASPTPVTDTSHRYRRRQGRDCQEMTGAELGAFSISRASSDWSAGMSASTLADIDSGAIAQIHAWLRASGEESRVALTKQEPESVMRALGFLGDDGVHLNLGGELFCVRRATRGPLLDLACRPAVGAETNFRLDPSEESLAVSLGRILAAIQPRNNTYNVHIGLTLAQFPAIPELALREALVNAVMHRDWTQPYPISILLEGDRLTVDSPGGFLPGVSAANVLTAAARTRNPIIASAMRSLRLAESEGIGVDRMFRETIRVGLPIPDLDEVMTGTAVRCVIEGGPPDAKVVEVVTALPGHSESDVDLLLVLHMLERQPTVNAVELAPLIQKDRHAARGALKRAQAAGVVSVTPHEGRFRLTNRVRELLDHRLPYLRHSYADHEQTIRHILERYGEVRARDLIDTLGITPVSASRILSQATAAGLLEKRGGKIGAGVYYVRSPG
jgi:ATP-dependent DNA helicase RecG